MSGTAYRLIGLVVWRALRWYLRELLPSPKKIVLSALAGVVVLGLAAGALRRATP